MKKIKSSLKIIKKLLVIALAIGVTLGSFVFSATAEEPKYGGTLTVAPPVIHSGNFPLSWDPADHDFSFNGVGKVYMDSLLGGDIDWLGPRGKNVYSFQLNDGTPLDMITGQLAERWEFTKEGMIFHLRRGIQFQGKPGVMKSREMTADDVVFSLRRAIDSPKRTFKYGWYKSIEVVDKYTVLVKMNYHSSRYGWDFAYGWMSMIYPKELVDAGIKDWKNHLGTGPFVLTDYVSGSYLAFDRNDNYWDRTVVDGKAYKYPFVKKLLFPFIPEPDSLVAALRSGKLDQVGEITSTYRESLAKSNPELKHIRKENGGTTHIGLRDDKAPWNNKKVRLAANMALDRKSILDSLYQGDGTIHNMPFATGWKSVYTPMQELPAAARARYEYNPEKAKQLLADAGYPDGFKTSIIVSPWGKEIVEAVAGYWAQVGIELNMENVENSAYWGIWGSKEWPELLSYSFGYTDYLMALAGLGPEGGFDITFWSDPKYKEMIHKIETNLDQAEQLKMLKEAGIYFNIHAPHLSLPQPNFYTYWQPWVKNYAGEINAGYYDSGHVYSRVWLDLDLKKKMGY